MPRHCTSGSAGPSPRERGSPDSVAERCFHGGAIPARAGQPAPVTAPATAPGVHPRASGAAVFWLPRSLDPWGPSPRERGSPASPRPGPESGGSIPARAGQPALPSAARPPNRVHPRASGAAVGPDGKHDLAQGPSPRERGSPADQVGGSNTVGSIPARAGQPCSPSAATKTRRVHPRASGAASARSQKFSDGQGPSPRERGSLNSHTHPANGAGSIPARAGQP